MPGHFTKKQVNLKEQAQNRQFTRKTSPKYLLQEMCTKQKAAK